MLNNVARRSKLCRPPALSCQEAVATLVKEPHNQSESLMQNQNTHSGSLARKEKRREERIEEEGSWEASNGKGNGNGLDAHEVVCGTKEP